MVANPRNTTSTLGRAYRAFQTRTMQRFQPEFLPWVATEDLEAVEFLAKLKPNTQIAALHRQMIQALTTDEALVEAEAQAGFRHVYDSAVALAQPATAAFLRHAQTINQFAYSHSLAQVQLETLKSIDREGHSDPTFGRFVQDLVAKLGRKTEMFDAVAYSQFFEIYGEAITLQWLRSRPGVEAGRVEESRVKGEGRPDFICSIHGGDQFYIEVKSLDIVDGEFRHREMMEDGLERQVEMEERVKEGQRVTFVEGEIAPYRGVGQLQGYDLCSLKLVIDTLRDKCRSAFKPSQFEMGPTFALAVIDRLILPGRHHALAPYYYAPEPAGCCLSGVLWHLAYGRIGTPIFRAPDFEGKPSLEDFLTTDGLYSDPNRPFLGKGLIILNTNLGNRVAYGLGNPSAGPEPWTSDETEAALEAVCNAQNDAGNSFGWKLSDARTL